MRRPSFIGVLGVLAIALVFPLLVPDQSYNTIAIFALVFAAFATAWNIFSGYTGYISLGSATYYGLGAYSMALLCQEWNIQGGYAPFLVLPLAGLIAGAAALPLGWFVLGTRRIAFVVCSIAILYIFWLLAYTLQGITNGSRGMFLPIPPWSGDFYNYPFYYAALALLVLATLVSWWIRRSKYGLALLAIRDDEERALGLGVKTGRYKLGAYTVSAVLIGMVGGLHGYFIGFISPPFAFAPILDITIVMMVYFGGVATLAGPILGAIIFAPLQQYLTLQWGGARGQNLMLFGGLLLLVILLLPEGILPTLRKRWVSRSGRKTHARPVSTTSREPAVAEEGERAT